MTGATEILSGRERALYGVIVSFADDAGNTLTLHRTGKVFEAVRLACDAAIGYNPDLRVTAVSTPTTIYADLQGRTPRRSGSGENLSQRYQIPEESMLSRAGRKHLAHPDIRGAFWHPEVRGEKRRDLAARGRP